LIYKTQKAISQVVLTPEEYGEVVVCSKYAEQLRNSAGKAVAVEVDAKGNMRGSEKKKRSGAKIFKIKKEAASAVQ